MGNYGLLTSSAQGMQNTGYAVQGAGQAFGGIASVASGFGRGAAYDAFGNYAQQVGEHNAQVALATSDAEVQRIRFETRQKLALLRAEVGNSGVAMQGTPLALLAEQSAQATYQAQLARYGGKVNAQQARFAGDAQKFQSRINAGAAREAGWAGLFSGLGSAAGSFLQLRGSAPSGGTSFDSTAGLGDAYVANDGMMFA